MSIFETFLQEPLVKAFTDAANRMTPEQLTITVITFGVLVTSGIGWRMWLKHREQVASVNADIEMERLDLEKQRLLVQALTASPPAIKELTQNISDFRQDLLKKLKPDDVILLPESSKPKPLAITGQIAAEITRTPREEAVEFIVEGNYIIYSVVFNENNLKLELIDTQGNQLPVIVPDGALNYEQTETLKNNGFGRSPIHMHLLLHKLRGQITKASLISLDQQPTG